jgi:hypothetical protein
VRILLFILLFLTTTAQAQYYTSPGILYVGGCITPSILGTLAVVEGTPQTLSSTTGGGTWSSSNTAVATIGTSSGTVTGLQTGTSVITYQTSATCKAFATVTVSYTWSTTLKSTNITLTGGNLTYTGAFSANTGVVLGVVGKSSGHFYWEITQIGSNLSGSTSPFTRWGITNITASFNYEPGMSATSLGARSANWFYNNTGTPYSGGASVNGDTWSFDFDIGAGTFKAYLKGVLLFTKTGLAAITWYPVGCSDGSNNAPFGRYTVNFGASAFVYNSLYVSSGASLW